MGNLNLYNARTEINNIQIYETKAIWCAESLARKDYSVLDKDTLEKNLGFNVNLMELETEALLRKTKPIRSCSELGNFMKPNHSRLDMAVLRTAQDVINDKSI